MKKSTKLNAQLWLSVCLAVFGCLLILSSFIVPPIGQIHHSILCAVGEVFTFSGSLMGIDYHYRAKRDDDNEDINN